jgi:hypothetical protein
MGPANETGVIDQLIYAQSSACRAWYKRSNVIREASIVFHVKTDVARYLLTLLLFHNLQLQRTKRFLMFLWFDLAWSFILK